MSNYSKHTLTCSPVTLLTYLAQQLRRHQSMLCENPEHLLTSVGHEMLIKSFVWAAINTMSVELADSPNLRSHVASFAQN